MPPGKTIVHIDEKYAHHRMPPGHPERAERIQRLLEHRPLFDNEGVIRKQARRRASRDELVRVHTAAHVDRIASTSGVGHVVIDPDTHTSELSFDTALLAAGGVLDVVDSVMEGSATNGFALVRPPGHHAESDRAMGFCLFNNVAVGARHLLDVHGLERILVLDWDVHHGNGTQRLFYGDPRVLFVSVHQAGCYPGSGSIADVGEGEGEGHTVNVPLAPGCGDAEYLAVFEQLVRPIAGQFRPQFVLVSAGFDAHRDDPLARMLVTERGFASMTSVLLEIAHEFAGGRMVAALEGGYHLDALAASVQAVVDVMRGRGEAPAVRGGETGVDLRSISAAREVHARYWRL